MSGGNLAPIVQADAIYTAADVATLLSHGVRWFRANRKRLQAEGFPPPVSCVGRPRWYGRDILQWLARGRAPALDHANAAQREQDERARAKREQDEWARVLADRARSMVAVRAAPAPIAAPVEVVAPAPAFSLATYTDELSVCHVRSSREREAIMAKRMAMAARGLDPDNRNDVSLARNLGII